jgi:perosamine synthetase
MKSAELALFGGAKTINHSLAPYTSFGKEEIEAGKKVLESGVLSAFFGSWTDEFFGGPKVREFETAWSKYFDIPYSISVNSATSGLIAALGAAGISPGDEIIVSPWTMCASATAIVVWNAIPVFADIDANTFNIDPLSIRRNISTKTRAIIVPDIFGYSADMTEIMNIATEHNLIVIEDASQAPGARLGNKFVGTSAHIGVFSLNYHKHIHTGEGGMCVTSDAYLAERMQLIRNHAEAVAGPKGVTNFSNLIGFNFRLGEIEAAIGLEQLKKLPAIAAERHRIGQRLNHGLKNLQGISRPVPTEGNTHVYYIYGMRLLLSELPATRREILNALVAEGVPGLREGYLNIHLLPMYQKKIAYGNAGFPWEYAGNKSLVKYEKGICPVAEDLQDFSFLGFYSGGYALPDNEIDLIIHAFQKIWARLDDFEANRRS